MLIRPSGQHRGVREADRWLDDILVRRGGRAQRSRDYMPRTRVAGREDALDSYAADPAQASLWIRIRSALSHEPPTLRRRSDVALQHAEGRVVRRGAFG